MKIGVISVGITSRVMYGMYLLEGTIARDEDYTRVWGLRFLFDLRVTLSQVPWNWISGVLFPKNFVPKLCPRGIKVVHSEL